MRSWLVGCACLIALPVWGGELELTIKGCPPGMPIRVALYGVARDFGDPEGRGALRDQQVQAGGDTTRLSFAGLPAGRYALAAYADLNGNRRLDSNFLGKPTEPYGFSRDVGSLFGPPGFEQAAIVVGDDRVEQTLHLK